MPRDLPIGNGRLAILFDADYRIRDFYYPHLGQENHLLGHPCRTGVWVDGRFAWLGPGWRMDLRYLPDTLVTDVIAEHAELGLRLRFRDAVDFHEDALLRRVTVENLTDRPREVRLFFHHDFHISQSEVGDTASYDPLTKTVTHYKRNRNFLLNILVGERAGIDHYAMGTKEHGGQEGTWRDAEDGVLEQGPIAHGSVDSTIAAHVALAARGAATVWTWLVAAPVWQGAWNGAREVNQKILSRGPEAFLSRTEQYWRFWARKEPLDFGGLGGELETCYRRSLLTVRTHIDHGGGIVASADSDIIRFNRDTYGYVWPRDGALVAAALDRAGYPGPSQKFFTFCADALFRDGYFLQKFNADGTLASSWHPWVRAGEPQLPIQEDETALVLWALWEHFLRYRDLEFVTPLYNRLVKRAAGFLLEFRDPATGLPRPSYDLWEERWGVHAFTTAAVVGALRGAARFAEAFGDAAPASRYAAGAASVQDALDRHLWRPAEQRFARSLMPAPGGGWTPDMNVDASLAGLFLFGAYRPDDPKVLATMRAVETRLAVKTDVGGLARYEGDRYHAVEDGGTGVPGNPWIITTLWLAQHRIALAKTPDELAAVRPLLDWARTRALPSGVMAEQLHPRSGAPLSVSPLTWSHAEFVMTVQRYLDRLEALSDCPDCRQPAFRKLRGVRA